jgi:hypothetical protein
MVLIYGLFYLVRNNVASSHLYCCVFNGVPTIELVLWYFALEEVSK